MRIVLPDATVISVFCTSAALVPAGTLMHGPWMPLHGSSLEQPATTRTTTRRRRMADSSQKIGLTVK